MGPYRGQTIRVRSYEKNLVMHPPWCGRSGRTRFVYADMYFNYTENNHTFLNPYRIDEH